MEFAFSDRSRFGANIFNHLNQKKNARLAQGLPVWNLSIGTPDFAPDRHVMEAVAKAALDPENYKYSLTELPRLTKAVQDWYIRRFGVELTAEEITSVYGSQEGIAHIAMALCDPGEIILAPSPCYPIFSIGPALCGARIEYYNLDPNNEWLPDLDGIDPEAAKAAKAIIVSFPSNPTCAILPDSFYLKLIDFANRNNIIVIHDNAYSEIYFDGNRPGSFLAFPGAKEIGVEFNSLSKTYNLTGARLSFLVGNPAIVGRFRDVRSQIDYGSFLPTQYAAIAALEGPQDDMDDMIKVFEKRAELIYTLLNDIPGVVCRMPAGAFYVLPNVKSAIGKSYKGTKIENTIQLAELLLKEKLVAVVPGEAFGAMGYMRLSYATSEENIRKGVGRLKEFFAELN